MVAVLTGETLLHSAMIRKPDFNRKFLYVIFLLPLLILSCVGKPEQPRKPNIVFILGDAMRLDHFGYDQLSPQL